MRRPLAHELHQNTLLMKAGKAGRQEIGFHWHLQVSDYKAKHVVLQPTLHSGSFQGSGKVLTRSLVRVSLVSHMLEKWKSDILGLPLKLRKISSHQQIRNHTVHIVDNSQDMHKEKTQHYYSGSY